MFSIAGKDSQGQEVKTHRGKPKPHFVNSSSWEVKADGSEFKASQVSSEFQENKNTISLNTTLQYCHMKDTRLYGKQGGLDGQSHFSFISLTRIKNDTTT